jgi:pathogenesis-related protein 1
MIYLHRITGMLLLTLGPLAGCTGGGGFNPKIMGHVSNAQRTQLLITHNKIRKRLNLKPLKWSMSLQKTAQKWANNLQNNNQCLMMHDPQKEMGENLAFAEWCCKSKPYPLLTPKKVVNYWAEEMQDYDYKTNRCQPGKQCGHYTQIVWHSTRKLGCAVAHCASTNDLKQTTTREVWVCRYSPRGNYIGRKPY